MSSINNLYPPIMEEYIPAFIGENVSIPLKISKYNSTDEIKSIHITIIDPKTNQSVLTDVMGIRMIDIQLPLLNNVLKIKVPNLKINQYYKVQARFSVLPSPKENEQIGNWLYNNRDSFSEWSKVSLVRRISTPELKIKDFEENKDNASATPTLDSSVINFIGKLQFKDKNESETLYKYNISVLNEIEHKVADSGMIYSKSDNGNSINEFNYTFKYHFLEGEKYKIKFSYETAHGYKETKEYSFIIAENYDSALEVDEFRAIPDSQNGLIKILIKDNKNKLFSGNITIRRASNKSNFTIWQDVKTFTLNNKVINEQIEDITVESGVWYKYCIQRRDGEGRRGRITLLEQPVMVTFDYIFLVGDQKQLRIKYNSSISSFKRVVHESLTDTLGSKYPFIKRNGNVDYKQFSLSGLITSFLNTETENPYMKEKVLNGDSLKRSVYENIPENKFFIKKSELYQGIDEKIIKDYNEKNHIYQYNDLNYEKIFRDYVIDFLYKNDIKLFKSPTEGNMFVKLKDISLSPKNELGRLLYDFSCTVIEMDDYSIDNCDKYNIQKIGTWASEIKESYEKIGQIYGVFEGKSSEGNITNIFNVISKKYSNENVTLKGTTIETVNYLSYLRIEIEDNPYLIVQNTNGELLPVMNKSDLDKNQLVGKGYIVNINNKDIIIGNQKTYTLYGNDTRITSLYFKKPTKANIDFVMNITKEGLLINSLKSVTYNQKIGQLFGTFISSDRSIYSIYKQIYDKYSYRFGKRIYLLSAINGIKVEADEGTVLYIQDSISEGYKRYVIGKTNLLELYDKDFIIKGAYFGGKHLTEVESLDLIKSNTFMRKDKDIIYENIQSIENPIEHCVYKVNKNPTQKISLFADGISKNYPYLREDLDYYNIFIKNNAKTLENTEESVSNYILHNGKWIELNENNDILIPIEAIVDYYCEVMQGSER